MFGLFVFVLIVAVCLWVSGIVVGRQAYFQKNYPNASKGFQISGYSTLALSVLFLFFASLYTVSPGEVGVEVLFGKIQRYSENGLRWKNPLATVEKFDIRTLRSDFKSEGMSKDMQLIVIESVLNYRIDFTRISDLYTKVGRDYFNKVIYPAVEQTVKEICSQYKVEEITVNRDAMRKRMEAVLTVALSNYYIIVQDINLADIDFSDEFNKVVEEKQLEEQKIKTAEYRKKQAEQDKLTTILQAQAESEKQRLLRNTTSKEVIELKRIEKWDGKYPVVMGGNNLLNIKLPE